MCGGSREKQLKEIKRIANFIDMPISDKKAMDVANQLFGSTITFRSGQIGSWKKHFNKHHKQKFKEIAGDLLIELGYETNYEW